MSVNEQFLNKFSQNPEIFKMSGLDIFRTTLDSHKVKRNIEALAYCLIQKHNIWQKNIFHYLFFQYL